MATKNTAVLLSALASWMMACGSPPDADLQELRQLATVSNGFTLNGFTLNGFTLNGFTLNGFTLNGFTLNGFTLNGFTLNGFTLNGFTLNGTLFSATNSMSQPVSGLDLVGMNWQVTITPNQGSPTQYTLGIDNIYQDPNSPSGDVYLYNISYRQSSGTVWQSLCADANGSPVPAIPLRNYWNLQTGARIDSSDVITFACVSGALGKCARLGYRPWAQATKGQGGNATTVSLADYHQACTRMVRADYCGTGTSYTLNGTLIELYDSLSPPLQTETMGWDLEAKWNPEGAFCLSNARHAELLTNGRYPDCNGNGHPGDVPNCGNSQVLSQALIGSTYHTGN